VDPEVTVYVLDEPGAVEAGIGAAAREADRWRLAAGDVGKALELLGVLNDLPAERVRRKVHKCAVACLRRRDYGWAGRRGGTVQGHLYDGRAGDAERLRRLPPEGDPVGAAVELRCPEARPEVLLVGDDRLAIGRVGDPERRALGEATEQVRTP